MKTSVSPRSSTMGRFKTSPAAKSEEKRMFSQAKHRTDLNQVQGELCQVGTQSDW